MPQTSASAATKPPLDLIGRDAELETALAAMHDEVVRLLTVTGPAGVGKTRFAIEIAETLADGYAAGAVNIDLTAIADPSDLDVELARVLGIRPRDRDALTAEIDDWLAARQVLLVLDNAEHVLGIAPRVAELIAVSRGSRVLVTSRHRLNLTLEHELYLEPLATRDDTDGPDPLTPATLSPSGMLFLQMIGTRARDADLKPEVLVLIERLCARLEGVPLALELVAARVPDLSTTALTEVFAGDIANPVSGNAEVLGPLESAVDWSYRLLSEPAQQLLRYLTVFAGGFSPELVERQVAHAHQLDLEDVTVWDCLLELGDHHLILPVLNARVDTPRFRILMLVSATVRRKLITHGEEHDPLQAHALGIIDFAELREDSGLRPKHEYQIIELEENYHNIIAALNWLREQDDLPSLMRLVGGLTWFWYAHGHYRVGQMWFERVLAQHPDPHGLHWARMMVGYGMILDIHGDFDEARDVLEAAYTEFVALGRTFPMCYTSIVLGFNAIHLERYDDAERILYRTIDHARTVDDADLAQTMEGLAWENLGANFHEQGRLDEGAEALQRALMIQGRIGVHWSVARTLCDVGNLDRDRGYLWAALTSFQAVLDPATQVGDRRLVAAGLAGLATVLAQDGQALSAAWLWGAVDALRPVTGIPSFLKVNIRAYQLARERARKELGDEQYAASYEAGSHASLDDILQLARRASLRSDATLAIPESVERQLSGREADVLRQLLLGLSTRTIATTLGISERTVSSHAASVYRKLGVNSRLELIALTIQKR